MNFRRQPAQVCAEVASLYNAEQRLVACAKELASDKKVNEASIRAWLTNFGIDHAYTNAFVGMWQEFKNQREQEPCPPKS